MKGLLSSRSILVALFVLLVPLATAKYVFNPDYSYWEYPFTDKRSTEDYSTPQCEESRTLVQLEDSIYIYRPNFYNEVRCLSGRDSDQQICEFGFHCVQLNRTIHFIKATMEDARENCWQHVTKEIPYGCSCMKSE